MTDVDQYTVSEDGLPVVLPSGAEFKVLTQSEVDYVTDRVKQYRDTYHWENISDVQDVDRVVMFELLVWRWNSYMARGKDWFGDEVDEANLQKRAKELSAEIRQVKQQSLGMDKVSRDRDRGEDSVAQYLERLRIRAKEFGINRNKMMDKGLVLLQEVVALTTLWDRCDEQERLENRCTSDNVCTWLRDYFIPEFQSVDEEFRRTSQKLWIQEM